MRIAEKRFQMENSGHKTSWKQRQEYPLWKEGEGGKEEGEREGEREGKI